jgi:hypothetical protein
MHDLFLDWPLWCGKAPYGERGWGLKREITTALTPALSPGERENRSPLRHQAITPDCRGVLSANDPAAAMPGRTLKPSEDVLSGSLSLEERVRVRASYHPLLPWRPISELSGQSRNNLCENHSYSIQQARVGVTASRPWSKGNNFCWNFFPSKSRLIQQPRLML